MRTETTTDNINMQGTDDIERDSSYTLPYARRLTRENEQRWTIRELFYPLCLTRTQGTKELRSTAYLDGLRGIAALIVYVAHSEAWCHDADLIQEGFGYHGKMSLITLPLLRVFFTGGHAAVAVFFVISGFVLSRKAIKQMHQKSEDVYATLTSAAFRRPIRLYYPFIVTTVLYFFSWHIFRLDLEWPKPQDTLLLEIENWWVEFRGFANPFRTPTDTWFTYDFPLWTIPVEFQGSLLILLVLFACSRTTIRARMSVTAALAVYFHHIGLWQMFCFLTGSLIAEADHLDIGKQMTSARMTMIRRIGLNSQLVFTIMFTISMYLAGQPSQKHPDVALATPGWNTLTSMVPSVYAADQWWRFWLSVSAPLMVLSLTQLPRLQRVLEHKIPQYFGRISFALYLIHIPIAATIGDKIFRIFGFVRPGTMASAWDNWYPIASVGPLGLELSFLLPQMFIAPITFYFAEIVTRLVDEPSITLGKWAYERVIEW